MSAQQSVAAIIAPHATVWTLELHLAADAASTLTFVLLGIVAVRSLTVRGTGARGGSLALIALAVGGCAALQALDVWTLWQAGAELPQTLRIVSFAVVIATAAMLLRIAAPAATTDDDAGERMGTGAGTSDYRYRMLTDALPQMVGIVDAKATVWFANRQWISYTGIPIGEDDFPAAERLIHPEDAATIETVLGASWSERDVHCELRIRRYDGCYRWHDVRIVVLPDEVEHRGNQMFVCAEIDEHRAMQAAFAVSEPWFAADRPRP